MELEIIEQSKIIPYILMKYINPETGEIKIDLPENITKRLICWKNFLKLNQGQYTQANFCSKMLSRMMKTRFIYL